MTVKKDGSKTTTKASYNAKKDVASASAKVDGQQVQAGRHRQGEVHPQEGLEDRQDRLGATLKKGTAKATFKNVKAKGSYSVVAKFKGDAGLKGSSGKATFKVK